MVHPEKWRETVDPFAVKFEHFVLKNVIGYPHAGNDVFQVDGEFRGEPVRAFLKIERQRGADIENEIRTLKYIPLEKKPEVLECSLDEPRFILTREANGERLSYILGENAGAESLKYMKPYGSALARLHSFKVDLPEVKHRNFFDIPEHETFLNLDLCDAEEFLRATEPCGEKCFVHGDFHYANILWAGEEISAVLDWELSGIGVREFDMAWAVVLRPGQKFLDSDEEIKLFLNGYSECCGFSARAFWYYYVQIALHFMLFGDESYRDKLRMLIRYAMKQS